MKKVNFHPSLVVNIINLNNFSGVSGGTYCYLSERWRFESHNRDVAEAAES